MTILEGMPFIPIIRHGGGVKHAKNLQIFCMNNEQILNFELVRCEELCRSRNSHPTQPHPIILLLARGFFANQKTAKYFESIIIIIIQ